MKTLFILRGVPGCGKSTLAEELKAMAMIAGYHAVEASADEYRMTEGGMYVFDPSQTHMCHVKCQRKVEDGMMAGAQWVIVHNTSIRQRDLRPYTELASKYHYKIVSLVVENRHGGKDVHQVPQEAREDMANLLSNSLKLI